MKIIDDRPAAMQPTTPADTAQLARQEAIKQIERRRRYWWSTIASTIAMAILVAIWAITEYHNAGGWPTRGFSQSSSIHDVWNIWIIYPAIAWVALTGTHGWFVYMRRPISEREVEREMQRQARGPSDD